MKKKFALDVRQKRAAAAQAKAYRRKCYETVSKYKGIKLTCAWTERDGRIAFTVPYLDDKIIWVPEELTEKFGKYTCVIRRRADLDKYFEEAGYPIEHIHLKMQMDKNKKNKVA